MLQEIKTDSDLLKFHNKVSGQVTDILWYIKIGKHTSRREEIDTALARVGEPMNTRLFTTTLIALIVLTMRPFK